MKEDSADKDFLFLTLIIYGFNNQIRFNSSGEFNMPVGKRDFNNSLRKNLKSFINVLKTKNIEFINSDFREIAIETTDNTLVYCDPPYFLGTASYNENGGISEQVQNNSEDFQDFGDDLSLGAFGESHSDTGFLDSSDEEDLKIFIIDENDYNIMLLAEEY